MNSCIASFESKAKNIDINHKKRSNILYPRDWQIIKFKNTQHQSIDKELSTVRI